MTKRTLRAALLFAVLSACGSSTGSSSASAPASGATVIPWFVGATNVQTTVKAGTTVQWQSTDAMEHTVTSSATPQAFGELQLPASGFSPPMAFNTPGTFPYFCSIHGARVQNGTLTVTP
jgi:plastocyanin